MLCIVHKSALVSMPMLIQAKVTHYFTFHLLYLYSDVDTTTIMTFWLLNIYLSRINIFLLYFIILFLHSFNNNSSKINFDYKTYTSFKQNYFYFYVPLGFHVCLFGNLFLSYLNFSIFVLCRQNKKKLTCFSWFFKLFSHPCTFFQGSYRNK